MSVLNQSGEESVDCPLCMEALEVDDLNFFPCTCGYQICRFCWHRIRTDENGLCPACRKAYSEDPADFIPLSKEQVAKLKAEKRHRDQQRKAKLSENRKHLASVRVVQRNLVFVVGLPVRLADPELLKKHEYFGKFGKIHKVVINQSTSYAGSQGPSASAYVTYMKSDDALRAIQSVNNIMIDGRMLKSSLGTTKYCSHFMKNQPCPKADCMYLHDFGDPEASFTKEQMHAGKHQEYEKKLHEALVSRQNTTTPPSNVGSCEKGASSCNSSPPSLQNHETYSKKDPHSLSSSVGSVGSSKGKEGTPPSGGSSGKDNWPQLSIEKGEKITDVKKSDHAKDKSKSNKAKSKNCPGSPPSVQASTADDMSTSCNDMFSDNTMKLEKKGQDVENYDFEEQNKKEIDGKLELEQISNVGELHSKKIQRDNLEKFKNGVEGHSIFCLGDSKLGLSSDNSSFFSQSFQTVNHTLNGLSSTTEEDHHPDHSTRENDLTTPPGILSDTFPSLNTSEDWVFGFENDHLEELAKQTSRTRQAGKPPKESLDTIVNGINTTGNILGNIHQNVPSQSSQSTLMGGYGTTKYFEDLESSRRYLEGGKLHENGIMDNLIISNSNKTNGFVNTHYGGLTNKEVLSNGTNGLNGLDHNMSKFFMDFHKNQTQLNMLNGINSLMTPPTQQQNGYYQQQTAVQEHLLLLQQKQLEEQLRNLNLKQQQQQQQNYQFQNGYYNRDLNSSSPAPFGGRHLYNIPVQAQTQAVGLQQLPPNPVMVVGQSQNKIRHPEDELDFDPFQETQKGLAELIATEKSQTQGRVNMTQGVHMNGLIHNQSNPGMGHIPPPPPGFVQPQNSAHVNSFGSKILPFLNMSNNPQSLNSPTQNNWSNGYVNPQKNISTNVNDWKNLDPAILSSSRHFPLANMSAPSIREHSTYPNLALNSLANLNSQTSPTTQNVRPHSYMNGTTDFSTANLFSNFAQQIQQPNLNGFTTHTNQLNSWFTNEAFSNTNNITSPPGFRNSQTKQQEC